MNLHGHDLAGIRNALLEAAHRAGFAPDGAGGEEAALDAFLDRFGNAAEPTDEECRRFYDGHPESFVVGAAATVSHILFAVTPGMPIDAVRHQAERTLARLLDDGAGFEAVARDFSNCPSGANGGWLGTLAQGDAYAEFESAVLGTDAVGVLPSLVRSRVGFHVVKVHGRRAGRRVAYEEAREAIALHLGGQAQVNALLKLVRETVANTDEPPSRHGGLPPARTQADVRFHRFAKRGP